MVSPSSKQFLPWQVPSVVSVSKRKKKKKSACVFFTEAFLTSSDLCVVVFESERQFVSMVSNGFEQVVSVLVWQPGV